MAGAESPRIAIVGGGFTGAAIAYHLTRLRPDGPPVTVIEPRETLGGGLAYSSREPAHRINVPATRMSIVPDEPEHFTRWLEDSGELERDPAAIWPSSGAAFPRRGVFGRYVHQQLAPAIEAGRLVHVRERVVGAALDPSREWTIELGSGARLAADIVVLATTHPLPATPRELAPIQHAPGYVADPYDPAALDGVGENARILIVGSGLTAADVVATLDRKGHRGPILALSRNGLRSRGHPARRLEWSADFAASAEGGVGRLVRGIRHEIATAAGQGVPWQAVMDTVRAQGGGIWNALPMSERQRLVSRLRSFWDVHRFRIAPQVEAVLDRRADDGTFRHIAARLVGSRAGKEGIEVTFRRRGGDLAETLGFERVVNTTGPSHRGVLAGEGLLPALGDAGHLRCDRVGLGLDTDASGRAIGTHGVPCETLFVAGPLARGTFGELMGLPEVSRYALFIAERLAERACEQPVPLARSA